MTSSQSSGMGIPERTPLMLRLVDGGGVSWFYCRITEPRPNEVPIAGAVEVVPAPARGVVDGRYELVRVAREMVEHLLAQDPQPVVLVGLERFDDGSVELVFRTPERGAVR